MVYIQDSLYYFQTTSDVDACCKASQAAEFMQYAARFSHAVILRLLGSVFGAAVPHRILPEAENNDNVAHRVGRSA